MVLFKQYRVTALKPVSWKDKMLFKQNLLFHNIKIAHREKLETTRKEKQTTIIQQPQEQFLLNY